MRLFDLIEQDNRVRFPANRLRQLSTLIVAHISRRRTDQTSRAEFLLILTHVDTGHHILEQILGQCLGQLRLTHTGSTEEDERTDRSFRILQAGTTTTNRIGDSVDRLFLTNHTGMKLGLQT